MMAVHRRGDASMTYMWRWGGLTPAWLDRGECRLARLLGRNLGRLGFLRREYRESGSDGVAGA